MKPSLELVTKEHGTLVELKKVYYLEANGSYTNVYYKKDDNTVELHCQSRHLRSFVEWLDERFVSIHRKTIINSDQMAGYNKKTREVTMKMANSPRLQVARRKWKTIKNLIKGQKGSSLKKSDRSSDQ